MSIIRTEVADSSRWADVVEVFGRRGDDPGWCWCRRFMDPPEGGDLDPDDNRSALRLEVESAQVARGLVATALLEAAVEHARQHGTTAVEGHPVDTDALKAKVVSGSALFTGTLRTFLECGFAEVVRTYASRPVMRRTL